MNYFERDGKTRNQLCSVLSHEQSIMVPHSRECLVSVPGFAVRFRYSRKNPMRFAVFWHISVRFCGFRTPLTPPSNYLHNYRSLNFLENQGFFFCTLHLKLTNLEVRHLIQVTESLIFTNLEISIFCAVQETSRHVMHQYTASATFEPDVT